MSPLRIAAFFDGRPGHEKQTLGLIRALERLTSVTVAEHRPPQRTWPAIWAFGAARALGGRLGPGRTAADPVDLILGTGSRIHPAMLDMKRTTGARAVTCMTPNFPLVGAFDLCLVPRHDRTRPAKNIFTTIGPPNPLAFSPAQDARRGLVLVGGTDPKSHIWDEDAVVEMVGRVMDRSPHVRWTVSSSPRTPAATEARLARIAGEVPRAAFFRARDTPAGWVETAYGESAVAWVTADSISMVYEALTAGCRVGILPVTWKRPQGKFARSEQYLLENRLVTSYEAWLETGRMAERPPRFDEAGRCAREILRRWWPNRLP